ncbi:cytospin-B-like [Neovison vison]|uniref:cytospin-B-like n=1 Tax=Neovison vison TaxID=452646 RepID=UPI001CF09473|nr:cytospin-B-like [Neogale vison]
MLNKPGSTAASGVVRLKKTSTAGAISELAESRLRSNPVKERERSMPAAPWSSSVLMLTDSQTSQRTFQHQSRLASKKASVSSPAHVPIRSRLSASDTAYLRLQPKMLVLFDVGRH